MEKLLSVFVLGILFVTIGYGQIFFTAKLGGSQEVPAVTTTATGTGTFVLSANPIQLTYNVTINGLSGAITGSHFHNGPAGVAAGVVKPVTFTGNTSSGVWSSTDASSALTDSLLSELLRGRLYFNVHTAANPNGEIRGQVLLSVPAAFTAKMDGSQENPPVTTTASGTGSVRLNTDGTVSYDLTIAGLTTTAQHFHNGPIGVNAGVVKNITLTNNTGSGTWASSDASQPLTDLLLRELVKGRLYMNAHTTANPGGEIRGQVLLNVGATFTAKLDGSQEVPSVTTTASGTGTFVLSASGTQLAYNVTINGLSGPITGSHFHNGPAGVAAGVVKPVTFTGNTSSGVWSSTDASSPLTDSLLSELLRGRLYFNVHTAANPNGEIRGQVLLTGVGFAVKMEGTQENPPVTTTASGTGSVRLNTDGTVSYDLTIAGLTTTAQHFHNGPIGVNAGVVKNITLTNNTGSGTWASSDASQPLTDLLLRELVKGRLYMNAHTTANPGGEIRGQVLGATGIATSVERENIAAVPMNFHLDQNYPNPFNPSTTINFEIAATGRVSLKVYNTLGQIVATLIDDIKQSGAYKVTFDASSFPSGVYFYRLAADGAAVQTKKMTLLK